MTNLIKRFANDEDGATAIEYGLIAALIAVAIIASVTALGENISKNFSEIDGQMTTARGTGGAAPAPAPAP